MKNIMRTIALFFVFFGLVLFLAEHAAERMDNAHAVDIDVRLKATTETIRAANIGVQMRVVSEGLFDIDLFTVHGSGVVFDADDEFYYALTNFHVVDAFGEGTPHYTVSLFGVDTPIIAERIAGEEALDLAIIRFSKHGFDIPLIDIYTRLNTEIRPDETVLALAGATAEENHVTYGRFTAIHHVEEADFTVLRHSAPLHHGYSGGALTDIDGNLIGINTWGQPDAENTGLAIPLRTIHEFLEYAYLKPDLTRP